MPLTKSEKRQIKHIEQSELKRGASKKHAREIANAVVYHAKHLKERINR